jgi:tetratricopeptide (TPR) repeat protein
VNNDKACIDIQKEVVNGMEEINNKEDGAITYVLERNYSSLAYFYRMTQDTNNIIKCYDKAIDYAKQNKYYDKQTKNNTIIDYLKKEIEYLTNEETILDRFNETMSLVRDNYLLDTTNMINKIKYACFIEAISNQNTDVIKDSSYTEDLKRVIPIEEEYETTYPYYFTKECFNSKMNLINKTRYEEVEKMQKDVNDLQKQYDKEEEIYGDLLIYNDYNVNKYRKQIAQYKGDSILYNDYIEKEKALNEKYAKYDYISSVIDNAKTYNDYAEYLYSQEKYDASLAYYDKAIEVTNTLAQKDNKYYASIGSTLLQKGDAYLYTKQYDKAIETYNKVIELESKVNEENKETYREDVAGALFFIGDAERAKENYKKALSYYDKAEKEYTTMSQKGKDVYQSFGELNMSRAYTYLSMKKDKKAREYFVNSYENYNKAPKDLISNKYLIVINTLNKYYEQDNDLNNYVKTKEKYTEVLANYVQQDMGYLPNYINSQIDLGDIFSAINRYPQADTSYNYALGGLSYMKDNGQNTDASYLKVAYKAAKIETSIDSFDSAINHLKECIDKSKSLYKDTAIDKYNNYTKDFYYELSRAYYFRGANNEENQQDYKKAKWAMDSSILILNSMNYKQDTFLVFDMSDRQRFLGIICSSINELTQSENALNEAISLILPYYKTEKETLEPAIISDYVLLGNLYYKLLKDNDKAKKSYYQAMSYYDNVSKKDKENSIRDYKQAVESLLNILAYDEDMKDKKEIERLKDINTKLRKLVPDEQE